MINHLPDTALEQLVNIYNRIIKGEQIPKAWRKILIVAFPKPNKNRNNPDNYRPIGLGSCPEKSLEIMIKTRIEWQLENQNYFSRYQMGFRRGMSTTYNIIYITSFINTAFNLNETVIGVFLDIKAAYDHVNIGVLYDYLTEARVPTALNNYIYI